MKISSTTKKYLSAGIMCVVVLVVAVMFSKNGALRKIDCNELFLESNVSAELPTTCSVFINEKEDRLDATFTKEGEIEISRTGSVIFSLNNDSEDEVGSGLDILNFGENPTLATEAVSFEDITFDGYADMAVRSSAGAYNFTYTYYAYNPAAKNFDAEPILEATNPTVDLANKTVESFSKGRGFGDIYVLNIYHFEDGKYVVMRSETQDIITDFDVTPALYERVINERREGEMVEVERKQLSEEDINTFTN